MYKIGTPEAQRVLLDIIRDQKMLSIEIGVGKGRFLCDLAQSQPDQNFIGIEKSPTWLKVAAELQQKRNLKNVFLFSGYAEVLLNTFFIHAMLANVYILFSDPWPKTYQLRRRVFSPHVMQRVWHALLPQGKIIIATDHKDYFETIEKMFSSQFAQTFVQQRIPGLAFKTNFQLKYEQEGRAFFFSELSKTSFPPNVDFGVQAPYLPKIRDAVPTKIRTTEYKF